VFGLEEDFGGKVFTFAHWAAIKSAAKLNPGYEIHYWCKYIPENTYFDDIRNLVNINLIEPPVQIFGNELLHFAHKADVIRLQTLKEYGGVYLDIDTITTKSFDDLLTEKCVLAYESIKGTPHGLCNAVMLAEKNSQFISEWLESYRSFRSKGRDEFWQEHSVFLPLQLAARIPESITILNQKTFFYPDWTEEGIAAMFYENHVFPEAYAHHLWEQVTWGALKSFNEFNYNKINCSYTSLLGTILSEEIECLSSKRRIWTNNELENKNAKINLGCGPNRDMDHINCDLYAKTGADLIFDMSRDPWPMPSDSVSSVKLFHVLEHLDYSTYEHFFRELYRVTKDGCDIQIRVPHPRHDWFLIDPTHTKAWHPESFTYLDKRISLQRYFQGDSKTPLALYWDIDFAVLQLQVFIESNLTENKVRAAFSTTSKIMEIEPYINNCISEIHAQLKTRKHTGQ
jgi:hypothetical protein